MNCSNTNLISFTGQLIETLMVKVDRIESTLALLMSSREGAEEGDIAAGRPLKIIEFGIEQLHKRQEIAIRKLIRISSAVSPRGSTIKERWPITTLEDMDSLTAKLVDSQFETDLVN